MSIALEHFLSIGYAICAAKKKNKIIIIFLCNPNKHSHHSKVGHVTSHLNATQGRKGNKRNRWDSLHNEYVKGSCAFDKIANINISHTSSLGLVKCVNTTVGRPSLV